VKICGRYEFFHSVAVSNYPYPGPWPIENSIEADDTIEKEEEVDVHVLEKVALKVRGNFYKTVL
jgi:hypothetical protein